MKCLIVGCGYVGLPLGVELIRQGHEVVGLRRSTSAENELKASGIKPLVADITKPDELARLPREFDWVVHCVSSTGGDVEDYRQAYLQGTRNLIGWLATSPPKKFVYTGSTSVYGQTDGSQVKETSPTEPVAETAKILLETEKVLLGNSGSRGLSPSPKGPCGDFASGWHLRSWPWPLVQAIPEKRGAHRRRWLPFPEYDSP